MDPATPVEPPPPAYEAQHDYDRKISDALERSLTIANQAPSSLPGGEEEWEAWDEARFEAAAAAARAGEDAGSNDQSRPQISHRSSEKERLARQDPWLPEQSSGGAASSSTSSPPAVHPSNATRRLPTSPPSKERPSWFAEAQLDTPAGSGSVQNNQAPSTPQVHHVPPEEDDPDEPLPPFAAVGPSLEGPPFEEVVRQPPRFPPGSEADSPPQSPLDGVDESDNFPDAPSFSPPPVRRAYSDNRHRPTSPCQSVSPPMLRPMPISNSSPRPPPMRFDPSVAYAKHRQPSAFSSEPESKEPVDASAFYNSSISSLLGASQQHQILKKNNIPNRETPIGSAISPSSVRDPYPSVPPIPPMPQAPPAPHSYYPAPTQYAPYAQPHTQPQFQPPQQPQFQYPQHVVPGHYGQHFQGAVPGPSPPPPPPHWPPPNNNMYGGGYGR